MSFIVDKPDCFYKNNYPLIKLILLNKTWSGKNFLGVVKILFSPGLKITTKIVEIST